MATGTSRCGPAARDLATADDGRTSLPYESSAPGIFAAGDVRHGSTKRVASAVGEGAGAISSAHRYLQRVPMRG